MGDKIGWHLPPIRGEKVRRARGDYVPIYLVPKIRIIKEIAPTMRATRPTPIHHPGKEIIRWILTRKGPLHIVQLTAKPTLLQKYLIAF